MAKREKNPLRLSRSRWDNFIKCPRCFYLKEKHDLDPPGQPGHPINSRVDALLKEEFDLLRKEEKPHKIFKEYNLNFIPYNKLDPEILAKYRNNFKGVEAKSKKTKYILFGALDDLWFNQDTKEIVVLDYKATSNKNLEDYKTSTKYYHRSYLRQLDFYAYLLKLNNYPVHKTGYWLICNAADENQKVFNNNVNFKTTLLPYELKTDYIEDTLIELEKCLESEEIPISGDACDNCRWFKEVKKTEELISINKVKKKVNKLLDEAVEPLDEEVGKGVVLDSSEKITDWVLKGYKETKEVRPNLKPKQIFTFITFVGTSPPAPQEEYNIYLLKQVDKVPGIVGLIIEFSCAKVELNKKSRTEIKKILTKILNVLESENYSNEEKFGSLGKKYLKYGVDVYVDFTEEFSKRVELYKKKYHSHNN